MLSSSVANDTYFKQEQNMISDAREPSMGNVLEAVKQR
jgi:hypothetical protein